MIYQNKILKKKKRQYIIHFINYKMQKMIFQIIENRIKEFVFDSGFEQFLGAKHMNRPIRGKLV